MVRRYSVSVPDAIAERADKWKDSFSPSEIFQRALEDYVLKKETFAKRLEGATEDMEEIIDRLKKQKQETENDYYAEGQQEGLDWAKQLDYSDLQYAAEVFNPFSQKGPLSHLPARVIYEDECLGETFQSIFEDHPGLEMQSDIGQVFTKSGEKFIAGWIGGVKAFWDNVSGQLDN